MIATDIFLEIGSQHKVCEDYIIQGMNPEPYIILSDGCSSSNNTEMGARILCHLAKKYIQYRSDDLHELDYRKMGQWIIHNAEMVARQLGLSVNCLDATLIIAYHLDDQIYVYMYGDGAIVTKDGGRIEVHKIDYTKNAPYYLSYQIDEARHDLYHEMGNDVSVTISGPDGESCGVYAYDYPAYFSFSAKGLDTLFITSDGLFSFIVESPTERRVVAEGDVLPDFMNFKNVKGEFLTRRLKKALKKLKNGDINHFDDLSIGAFISIED